ncbi:MAG: 4Fe-4S binding protein [Endomicrobium sp.]|jgi:MinD superfamily P-loop ATPase|nr:4Fe-4S binding protein [Endomicrobium sp.]
MVNKMNIVGRRGKSMIYKIDVDICVGCGACATSCPISIIEQKGGKYIINSSGCKGCGVCESTCPVSAISKD